ncbi:hypothetical protein DOY81_011090, partial [Sarcophaga bullata]
QNKSRVKMGTTSTVCAEVIMELSSVILQISFLIIFGKMLAFGFVGPEERKCKYLRVDKITKIRCYNIESEGGATISQNISGGLGFIIQSH